MVFPAVFNLADLNASNGFAMKGISSDDDSGGAVSGIGDFNGDGLDDVTITGRGDLGSRQSYVVFGSKNGFPNPFHFSFSDLNGANGFIINDISSELCSHFTAVSGAGDINGDGLSDVLFGLSYGGEFCANDPSQSYVIFGSKYEFPTAVNSTWLNGQNGFILSGINPGDGFGEALSRAGDVNADGIADIIIGAPSAGTGSTDDPVVSAGQSYVIFGNKAGFPAEFSMNSLNGANGFTINGIDANDQSGGTVSAAGDVNADGIDDIIIATPYADNNAGQSYVIFGSKAGFSKQFNLANLNGVNGFTIQGINKNDVSGDSVSGAGDVNNDGIADIIIGAPYANNYAGQSYVIFGSKTGFPAQINLSSLSGTNGFTINGINNGDNSGLTVSSAGDVNDDGIADIIIGAPSVNNNGYSYVIFGSKNGFPAVADLSKLNAQNGFTINGINSGDWTGYSVSSAGDFNGDGIADIIIGACKALGSAGETYMIYGQSSSIFDSNLEV